MVGELADLTEEETYVTLEEAVRLSGLDSERLANLVRRRRVTFRGSSRDPLFALSEVRRLGDLRLSNLARFQPQKPVSNGKAVPAKVKWNQVVTGHALDVIHDMPHSSAQAVITSPPFWGQRVYADEQAVTWADGSEAPFGREPTPDAYVAHTLEILSALLRVLKPNGTVWWNLGDSYMTRSIARESSRDRILHYAGDRQTTWKESPFRRYSAGHEYLKDKDLTLVPFLIAIGAQKLGYWVRSIIIWSKTHKPAADQASDEEEMRAHVPEVVQDRPVVGHEYILLLARSVAYDYYPGGAGTFITINGDRTPLNTRTVWSFPPVYKGNSHSARFPSELPRRCILLGTKRNDVVFDPFAGEGTTLLEARKLSRRYYGCDISPTYVEIARAQLSQLDLELETNQPTRTRRTPGR